VRTVRRFVDEEERAGGGGSPAPRRPASPTAKERHQEPAVAEEAKPKVPITHQVSEQSSTREQEEEFAKQLRLARSLAAGGSRHPGRWSRFLRQKRLSEGGLLQRRGLRPRRKGWPKKAREEELAKRKATRGTSGTEGAIRRFGARGEAAAFAGAMKVSARTL